MPSLKKRQKPKKTPKSGPAKRSGQEQSWQAQTKRPPQHWRQRVPGRLGRLDMASPIGARTRSHSKKSNCLERAQSARDSAGLARQGARRPPKRARHSTCTSSASLSRNIILLTASNRIGAAPYLLDKRFGRPRLALTKTATGMNKNDPKQVAALTHKADPECFGRLRGGPALPGFFPIGPGGQLVKDCLRWRRRRAVRGALIPSPTTTKPRAGGRRCPPEGDIFVAACFAIVQDEAGGVKLREDWRRSHHNADTGPPLHRGRPLRG